MSSPTVLLCNPEQFWSVVSYFSSVGPDDYLNTFDFLDKLQENLTKKQAQSRL